MPDALRQSGTYALVLRCPEPGIVKVGALGEVTLGRGYLVYIGSAFGSGGLAGRLRHHLRPIVRPHWHIDYIRRHCETLGAWLANGDRGLEHSWAGEIAKLANTTAPHPGFGSSDCRCDAHLFRLRRNPSRAWFRSVLEVQPTARDVAFYSTAGLDDAVSS